MTGHGSALVDSEEETVQQQEDEPEMQDEESERSKILKTDSSYLAPDK